MVNDETVHGVEALNMVKHVVNSLCNSDGRTTQKSSPNLPHPQCKTREDSRKSDLPLTVSEQKEIAVALELLCRFYF